MSPLGSRNCDGYFSFFTVINYFAHSLFDELINHSENVHYNVQELKMTVTIF